MNYNLSEGASGVPSTAGAQKNGNNADSVIPRMPEQENTSSRNCSAPEQGAACAPSAEFTPPQYNAAPIYSAASASAPQALQRKSFTAETADIIFVIATFLLGYYFTKKLIIGGLLGDMNFNLFVFTALFSAAGVVYIAVKHRNIQKIGFLYIALGILCAVPSLLYPLYYPFLNTLFSAVLCTYGLSCLAGHRLENILGDYFGKDIYNCLIFKPFANFGTAFSTVFYFFRSGRKKGGKNALFVFLGIMGCFIIGIPVAALLCSADDIFNSWIGEFLSFDFEFDFFPLILTIPVFLYLYGFFYSCANGRLAQSKSLFIIKQREEGKTDKPQILFLIPGIFLLCIYALFFAAHIISLGKIAGTSPKIYADYARQGFFQLCAVAAINLLFIIFSRVLCAKKGNPRPLRVCGTLIGLSTLLLLAFATLKLGLYISFCGITEKRLFAAWGIFVIAVVFAAVIASQYKKFNYIRLSFFAVVISFIILTCAGTGNITAFYNLDRCLNGTLDGSYTEEYIDTCPESAAVALCFAEKNTSGGKNAEVNEYIQRFTEQYDYCFPEDGGFENVSHSAARQIFENSFCADSHDDGE